MEVCESSISIGPIAWKSESRRILPGNGFFEDGDVACHLNSHKYTCLPAGGEEEVKGRSSHTSDGWAKWPIDDSSVTFNNTA